LRRPNQKNRPREGPFLFLATPETGFDFSGGLEHYDESLTEGQYDPGMDVGYVVNPYKSYMNQFMGLWRGLAKGLGRIRGKLAYRPVVFELLPGEFALLRLQQVAEALSGTRLHKQNFRRLVMNAHLVEPIGRTTAVGRGRPAELFRFRREVLGEKLTVGLSRPTLRGD